MFTDMARFTKRNKASTYELSFCKFVSQIKNQHFADLESDDALAFHLGSLICPNDIIKYKIGLKGIDEIFSTGNIRMKKILKIYQVHDALYKFSINKLMQWMKNQYYARLFRVYYDELQRGNIDFPNQAQNLETYRYAFKMLLGVCDGAE